MTGPPSDGSHGTRGALAVRMALTLAAVTPINLAFGGLLVLIVVVPVVVPLQLDPTALVEPLVPVVEATVGPVSVAGLGTAWTLIAIGTAALVGAFAFVVPLRLGPDLLVQDVDAAVVRPGEEPRLASTLTQVATQADVPAPRLAVVESAVPRSFAAGRRGEGTVVVTRGLLEALDDDELAAVLAHELSHLVNRDATVICYPAFYPLAFAMTDDEAPEDPDPDRTTSGAKDAIGTAQDPETDDGGTGTVERDPGNDKRGTGADGERSDTDDPESTDDSGGSPSDDRPSSEPDSRDRVAALLSALPLAPELEWYEQSDGTMAMLDRWQRLVVSAVVVVHLAVLAFATIYLAGFLLREMGLASLVGLPFVVGLYYGVMMVNVWVAAIVAHVVGRVLFVVLQPPLAVAQYVGGLLAASLSRSREFAADRGAVAITGDPAALASALETLDAADPPETDLRAVDAVEPLSIVPIQHRDPEGLMGRLRFRTHPPTEDRIERLREMVRRRETAARAPDG